MNHLVLSHKEEEGIVDCHEAGAGDQKSPGQSKLQTVSSTVYK